jgi:hypothetical protein
MLGRLNIKLIKIQRASELGSWNGTEERVEVEVMMDR